MRPRPYPDRVFFVIAMVYAAPRLPVPRVLRRDPLATAHRALRMPTPQTASAVHRSHSYSRRRQNSFQSVSLSFIVKGPQCGPFALADGALRRSERRSASIVVTFLDVGFAAGMLLVTKHLEAISRVRPVT